MEMIWKIVKKWAILSFFWQVIHVVVEDHCSWFEHIAEFSFGCGGSYSWWDNLNNLMNMLLVGDWTRLKEENPTTNEKNLRSASGKNKTPR